MKPEYKAIRQQAIERAQRYMSRPEVSEVTWSSGLVVRERIVELNGRAVGPFRLLMDKSAVTHRASPRTHRTILEVASRQKVLSRIRARMKHASHLRLALALALAAREEGLVPLAAELLSAPPAVEDL